MMNEQLLQATSLNVLILWRHICDLKSNARCVRDMATAVWEGRHNANVGTGLDCLEEDVRELQRTLDKLRDYADEIEQQLKELQPQ